ncbi:YbfB/YjiJ family MFS transporter [Ideonella sp. DXS22W]|uniref:YbfB/YjiJ family MFS transporter n=1 Tax=Pseudaquabacterium inlustre TaxID=2984192 RepID=A0ABU9CGI5_9BURK
MPEASPLRRTLLTALALALGAAVSLGLARFSYALLLPPMREALGWRYVTAGAMNTVNAAGYLLGALAMPVLLRRWGATRALLGGSAAAALLLAAHGLATGPAWADAVLYALRLATGTASAVVFVSGGLMAARLGLRPQPAGSGITPGLVLGLYYGGTGAGIVACALGLPPLIAWPAGALLAGWPGGWIALGALALAATAAMAARRRDMADLDAAAPAAAVASAPPTSGTAATAAWRPFGFGLAAYFMFGLGYIGYMTFIVTLLREQQHGTGMVVLFYSLLGVGVMASPWLWAGLLQRHRDGRPLASLSALLAVATLAPVLSPHALVALASGVLFGAVFLSVVASTTALVRHNLPPAAWPAGISAFTIVFAAGQIVGPSLVGRLADGAGGLQAGLAVSAGVLALGALLATRQKALPAP